MKDNNLTIRLGGGGFGLSGVLTIVFIVAKLLGLIEWSWVMCLCPIFVSIAVSVILFFIVVVIVAVDEFCNF